jgi:hypothetical protein
MAEWHFNHRAGKNWLYSQGWSYLWCGWNCDVIPSDRKLNINVPIATENGETITGRVYSEIISYAEDLVYSRPLVWGGSMPYQPVTMNTAQASLSMRQYRWEEPVEVPSDKWAFARFENGQVVPDSDYLYVEDGIKPGWLYDLVYTAKNPRLTGLGLAAIRDVVSFFRYEEDDENGFANPLAGHFDYTYAWGHSQSARLLNHFLYQDFNGDELNRIVFDGVIANCGGGGKGQFNSRFAQTTRHGSHHEEHLFPIDFFPFNTVEQYDPVTGETGDGLGRVRQSGFLPKLFFINSATDYWTRAASLLHTDVEGKKDAAIDPNVRIYLVASKTHVEDRIGILARALLTALDQWVHMGVEPPASQIPKIADGTLVNLEDFLNSFPDFPGVLMPPSYYNPYRLNPGPRWHTEGIADNVPPETGPRYVCLVPQVDDDGNEIAGIRMPEIAVPLATFTGWTMRDAWYSNTLGRNTGTVWSFPRTPEVREQTDDSRKSISERYPTKGDYLFRVSEHLLGLKQHRFLLDEDLTLLLNQAVHQATILDDLREGDLPFVSKIAIEEGAKAGAEYFQELWDADLLWWFGLRAWEFRDSINAEGYQYLTAEKLETAFEVFKLNTLIFPGNWNVWDSLAECYYHLDKIDLAIEYYEKSLALYPGNANAVQMLEKIKAEYPGKN